MRTHHDSAILHVVARWSGSLLAGGALALAVACDTSVTNPGLVPDDALNKPEAWPAIVIGARRALADAIGSASGTGGSRSSAPNTSSRTVRGVIPSVAR